MNGDLGSPSLGAEMVAGLSEFCDVLEAGEPIEDHFIVHMVPRTSMSDCDEHGRHEADVELQSIADQVRRAIESGRTDAELEKSCESSRGLRDTMMRSDRNDPEKLRQRMTI
jgi:hypothetical protein